MKYIMTKNKVGLYVPVLFHSSLIHAHVWAGVKAAHRDQGLELVSAGSTTIVTLEASGDSETLGIASKPEDSDIIMASEYGFGDSGMLVTADKIANMMRLQGVKLLLEEIEERKE